MTDLILASGSATRRKMLEDAGLAFRVVPADVDEDDIRDTLVTHDPNSGPVRMAQVLARAKAEEVSRRHPEALVIGGDQILALGREVFTKPADLSAARAALQRLSGRTHALHSAVTLACGGSMAWQHVETARLTMRALSDGFIDDYLARAGERVCASVGAYELEGLGIQLFERIEGDYFTILGLPLLPLLAELRHQAVMSS
jgi:septum formation protein